MNDMDSSTAPQTVEMDGWVVRQKLPPGAGPHPLFVLLHGWTGDENAMWIFASRLPGPAVVIAPRGLYTTPLGGYGWHPHNVKAWPWVDDFLPAVDAVSAFLTPERFPRADFSQVSFVGFSQGAALAFTFALQYPERVRSLAGLAGFLPDGYAASITGRPLNGIPIFMAHGTRDELVPVDRARQAVDTLKQAGAKVVYCEHDVGHKLNADCFRGMGAFFKNP